MDTTNMNTSVTNINNLRMTDVWTGNASEAQNQALESLMQDLNKCINDISAFDAILALRDKYVEICDEISRLDALISSCSVDHSDEDASCSCGTYSAQIQQLEKQRQELRTTIIGLLGQFSGISPEIAPPADLTTHDNVTPDELETIGEFSNGFPLYDQNDYKGVPFGNGDVASSGCGISCAAMVITKYTGQTVTPEMLANDYNIRGLSNAQRMEKALEGYGVVNANNWNANGTFDENVDVYHYDDVKEKLEQGYTAIILMNEGDFTGSGHFVLATGVTDDGKILINDPNGNNYTRGNATLNDGYANGFSDSTITSQWSGCWLIEPEEEYRQRQGNN